MTVGSLDKRTAFGLIAGLAVILVLRFVVLTGDSTGTVVSAAESIDQAKKRLERIRQVAATVPGKETVVKEQTASVQSLEKGVFNTATESEARAKLLEMVNEVAKANGIQPRGQDDYHSKPISNDYGEVTVTVSFTCDIVQLVNFLAGLASQDQILATNGIHITGGTDKKKMLQVRLGVSGLVPRKLLPTEKKGLAGF